MDHSNLVTLDVECYKNYLLVMFRKVSDGKVIFFEKMNDSPFNIKNIFHILDKYVVITFNGIKYDALIVEAACAGFSNEAIYKVNTAIIEGNLQPWQVRKQFGFPRVDFNHIDLLEVAPLKAGLKIYAGRLHTEFLEDLPIPPEATITEADLPKLRSYCGKDNYNTSFLFSALEPEVELRSSMSEEYKVDLRSKSDAQIAEAVIKSEMEDKYGFTPKRPKVPEGTEYYYKAPSNLVFETDVMKDIFSEFTSNPFIVQKSGHVALPDSLKNKKFKIGDTTYKIGVGGLHSCEKSVRHTNENCILRDYDVASYYPRIILNNRLFPKHIGEPFLDIYDSIVRRRLKAKKEGNKVINESLKITINGSFGKFGSKWSCLYSPDLMMQVTVTGQLTLLMLIERLELNGISVISANTDGIVVKMDESKEELSDSIVSDWEFDTNYEMESTDYLSLNSRDVNNYIAVKKGDIKGKGAYADQREHYYRLRSNPGNDICTEAVKLFLSKGTPVEDTIRSSKDITKFLTLRTVNGGAVKEGTLLGKAIRWYYGAHELDAIYYHTNGNKVPKSDHGVPLMDLPEEFPSDVDYDWYIEESKRILKDIGYK